MASLAVQRIAVLYRIERAARDLSSDERLAMRQDRKPLLRGHQDPVGHDAETDGQVFSEHAGS